LRFPGRIDLIDALSLTYGSGRKDQTPDFFFPK
jgi:hypothetical protein